MQRHSVETQHIPLAVWTNLWASAVITVIYKHFSTVTQAAESTCSDMEPLCVLTRRKMIKIEQHLLEALWRQSHVISEVINID